MKPEDRAWAKAFGERLKRGRENLERTQEQLAADLGVSRIVYRRWEVGAAIPNSLHLGTLARLLGCSIADLVEERVMEDPLAEIFKELEKACP